MSKHNVLRLGGVTPSDDMTSTDELFYALAATKDDRKWAKLSSCERGHHQLENHGSEMVCKLCRKPVDSEG